jgi:polysaccharide transporter, PST family
VGFLLAGPISQLLNEPRLEPILQVLSLTFIGVALASIQVAILRREMDFRRLAVRKLLSIIAGGVVGIGMALNGYGAWALVGQQLAAVVTSVVLLWAVSPWRPSLEFSAGDFRSLFSFGLNVVAGDFLGFISRNTDNLLIGAFLGPTALGFYAVAYRILDTSQILLIAAARRLVFPSFARLQKEFDRLRRAYMRMTRLSSVLTLPGYIGLALVAHEAIVVIFGAKWAPAAPAASALFLIGPALTLQAFSGAVWNAVGQPGVTLRFRLISTITNVVGFVIAVLVFGNITAVAIAYTVRGYLLLPLNLYWMRVYAGVSIREHLLQLRSVAASTLVMAVVVLAVKLTLGGEIHNVVLLILEVGAGVAAFGVSLWVLDRTLLHDVVVLSLQVMPGGESIAGRLGLQLEPRGVRRPADRAELAEAMAPLDPEDPSLRDDEDDL